MEALTAKPCSKCKSGERQRNGWCRSCNNAWAKDYRQSEESKISRAKWRQMVGKEYYRERQNEFRKRNPEYAKEYKRKHPDRQTNYSLKHKYGISAIDKSLMLMEQKFLCASCEERLDLTKSNGANIDHCHASNVIRGILCSDCNVSLGRMKENPERIRKLAAYAEKAQLIQIRPSSTSPPPTAFGGGGEVDRTPPDHPQTDGEPQ